MSQQEKDQLLKDFRDVLNQVGVEISANDYDRLNIEKPPRTTLRRLFGCSWAELKSMALGDNGGLNTTQLYLIEQNKNLLRQLEKERDKTQAFLTNCLASISKINIKPVKVPKRTNSKLDLQFHSLRSDAQVGEKIEEKHVNGLSYYGIDEYRKRHDRLVDRILLFKEQDGNSLGLNRLKIIHLGDQVEGESIYPGQPFYLDANLIDQLFTSIEVESGGILSLAEYFTDIEVFCVGGNHGRVGKKGDHHNAVNFDYLFYRGLQTALKEQPNVRVYVSESPSMVVRHGGFSFLYNHLDSVRSWAGIPYYGLERMSRKLPGLYNMIIDYVVGGHHHQPTDLGDELFINGCFPGGSELSINKMHVSSRPSQKIFYFDEGRGINRKTDIYLADPVQLEADANGIYTPYAMEGIAG